MAKSKSCFTLKNLLVFVFILIFINRFILKFKEGFKEVHAIGDEKCTYPGTSKPIPGEKGKVCPGHCDENHDDFIIYGAGACAPAPTADHYKAYKYIAKIGPVDKAIKSDETALKDNDQSKESGNKTFSGLGD